MKKVSLLIPAYNEEAAILLLYERLQVVMASEPSYEWEVLFVNDGSSDNTLQVIKQLRETDDRIHCLDLSRNFGKEAAMLAGFDYVSGDCMVIMDADLQHPPELIPEMLKHWEAGYDDVYARRTSRGKESWLRRKLSLLFYSILQRSAKVDILANAGDFRLLDRQCVNILKMMRESERYTKGMFAWIGFRKKEVLYEQGDRLTGSSSWNLLKLFDFALNGITSFTTAPLRLSIIAGLIISFTAFAYMCFILVKTLLWGEIVPGYPTLIIIILFLGGMQLVSLGVIGEYIGRIFHETKNRPPYIVREHIG